METITVKLLKNGQGQTVCIPEQFQFVGTDEVTVCRQGNSVIITPKRKSWLSLAESNVAADDFMMSRPELFADRVKF